MSLCGCYVEHNVIILLLLFSKRHFYNIIQYSAVASGRKPLRIHNGKLTSYKNIFKINPLHFYLKLATWNVLLTADIGYSITPLNERKQTFIRTSDLFIILVISIL
jgi:hypothetical protein